MDNIYVQYDEIMIGKRKDFSKDLFSGTMEVNEKNALKIFRYAFDHYVEWPTSVLEKEIDRDLIEKLKLMSIVHYVRFPKDYDRSKDFFYIVSKTYRSRSLSMVDQVVHTYEGILDGSLSKYPKDYFSGARGIVNASICLRYVISRFIDYESINDLYYIFSKHDILSVFKKYRLTPAYELHYDCPIDYLHFSLPKDIRNDFYYHYYTFQHEARLFSSSGRRKTADCDYKLKGALI